MTAAVKKSGAGGDPAIAKAIGFLGQTQEPSGAWKGDYGGPLFLLPVYVAGMTTMEQPLSEEVRQGFIKHLRVHQNPDGGFGLDVESHSHVFTSVLNYVALRLMGVPKDDPAVVRAREWFLPRGGALESASWGKFMLAMLGLYEYDGLEPVPPELWLLPKSSPIHPWRMWCHCRMVYLPMAWLYGARKTARLTPVLQELRDEIYAVPYAQVDFRGAKEKVSPTDAYTPRAPALRAANRAMRVYEKLRLGGLRQRALDEVLEQIRGEDLATDFICIGPINQVLNAVVWHFAKPGGHERTRHLERMQDYLYRADKPYGLNDGIKVNGYNSSELWDTAFAVQALAVTDQLEQARPVLEKAAEFIEANQVLEDSPDHERYDRHPSKGGWPFSTRAHGWPISDCTGEGLKASLLLEQLGLNKVSHERLGHAVELILSLQNEDGGWATYELQRAPLWLETLNPSDVFSTIMVDVSYVECTSSCITALMMWKHSGTALHRVKVDRAIARGLEFIRRQQRADGSWEGSWGVCFTYGTWFATTALAMAGVPPTDPALHRAAVFLESKQREDGSWSELAESCRAREWVEGKDGHAVNTAWALLALAACGRAKSDVARRGIEWLRGRQREDGTWAPEPIAGVFNKTCAIHYDAYLKIFPMWALAECAKAASKER